MVGGGQGKSPGAGLVGAGLARASAEGVQAGRKWKAPAHAAAAR